MNRTDRLYAIVEDLRAAAPSPLSAPRLAERFEVSVRTIERDLSALQQAGVPIHAEPGRTGGYVIDPEHTLPPLNLTAAEVAAVAIALASTPTPFPAAGRSALQKMTAVLDTSELGDARNLGQRVRIYVQDRPRPPAVVEHAILQRRVVVLDYVDREGAVSDRPVEPVAVVNVEGRWYIWGWCRLREAPRSFRLDRIKGATMTDEIAPDRGLDPDVIGGLHAPGRRVLADGTATEEHRTS